MGLYQHKNAYLRDNWNVLDFLIVVLSVVDMLVSAFTDANLAAFRALRAMRVVRPLRSVKRLPVLRRLVSIIMGSIPQLANTQALLLFFFIVFGIVGVQNFHTSLYNRCRLTQEPVDGYWQLDEAQSDFICRPTSNDQQAEVGYCAVDTYCGSPLSYTDLDAMMDDPWHDELIDFNTVNYNDLWSSMMLVFEALTREGWSTQMVRLMQAGQGIVAIPFFMLLLSFGSYFILNLNLAVILAHFTHYEKKETEEKERKLKNQKLIEHNQLIANDGDSEESNETAMKKFKTSIFKMKPKDEEKMKKMQQVSAQQSQNSNQASESTTKNKPTLKLLDRDLLASNQSQPTPNFVKKPVEQSSEMSYITILSEQYGEEDEDKKHELRDVKAKAHELIEMTKPNNQARLKSFASFKNRPAFNQQRMNSLQFRHDSFARPMVNNIGLDSSLQIVQTDQESSEIPLQFEQKSFKRRFLDSKSDKEGGESLDDLQPPILGPKKSSTLMNVQAAHPNIQEFTDSNKSEEDESAQNDAEKPVTYYESTSTCYEQTTMYKVCHWIVMTQTFNIAMLLAISVNTVSLAMDRYPISQEEAQRLEMINFVCTQIFIVEMVLKLVGLGIVTYVSEGMNQFDALVVIVSIIEWALSANSADGEGPAAGQALTLFRGFRLLRVFRLARQLENFNRMIIKIAETVIDILIFFMLLLIIVLVFSLLGVELFNNYVMFDKFNNVVTEGGLSPRLNFDGPLEAIVSVFVCLIGDDWNVIMQNMVRAKQSKVVPSIYFLLVMVVGHLILMNLFLAILLKNFEEKQLLSEDYRRMMEEKKKQSQKQEANVLSKMVSSMKHSIIFSEKQADQKDKSNESSDSSSDDNDNKNEIESKRSLSLSLRSPPKLEKTASKIVDQVEKKKTKKFKHSVNEFSSKSKEAKVTGYAFFCFSPKNPLRLLLSQVVVHPYFESAIFFIVGVSCVLIALEAPLSDMNSSYNQNIRLVNDIITGFFFIEFLMKAIVYGFLFNGPHSYLRNGWNLLDFIILDNSIGVTLGRFSNVNQEVLQNLEVLKMLRVLRSMKLVTSIEGLRLCVLSLINSIPGIFNVAVVTILFFSLFGIFFLNLFKGSFYNCWLPDTTKAVIDFDGVIKTKYDCINYGGRWVNALIRFDSMADSLMSLFIIATAEGIVPFMNQATDAVGPGMQPQRDHNPIYKYVIIIYILFCSMFTINLFIQVVVSTFDKEQAKIDGNYMLTEFQKEWITVQLKCYSAMPKQKFITSSQIRLFCLNIAEWEHFDKFIMFAILMNSLALCTVWPNVPEYIVNFSDLVQGICTWVFIFEAIIKIIAYQLAYFYDAWNIFDFVIVASGIISAIFRIDAKQMLVLRILRVCRVLRLIRKLRGLYQMFCSFIGTIPAFANVGSLVLIMIFIFASLGSRLFAHVKLPTGDDTRMNQQLNFQTFGSSFLSLVAVMTGESWYVLMAELSAQPSIDFDCMQRATYTDYVEAGNKTVGCGNGNISRIFFVLYIFIVQIVLVNLFVAVTIQGFDQIQREDSCRITDYYIDSFIEIWRDHDPEGSGYIHISEATNFFRSLIDKKPELMAPKAKDLVSDYELLTEFVEHLELKLYKGFSSYQFNDCLLATAQMQLKFLASKPSEYRQILDEVYQCQSLFIDDNDPIEDLDDVTLLIEEIRDKNSIKLCKNLDKCKEKFRDRVVMYLDQYEGKFYNSSMISIVVRIQRVCRMRRQMRREMEEQKELMKVKSRLDKGIKEIFSKASNSDKLSEGMSYLSPQKGRPNEARRLSTLIEDNLMNLKRRVAKEGLDKLLNEQTDKLNIPKGMHKLQIVNSCESLMPEKMRKDIQKKKEQDSSSGRSARSAVSGNTKAQEEQMKAKLRQINRRDMAVNSKQTRIKKIFKGEISQIISKNPCSKGGDKDHKHMKRLVVSGDSDRSHHSHAKIDVNPEHSQIIQLENYRKLKGFEVKIALNNYLRDVDKSNLNFVEYSRMHSCKPQRNHSHHDSRANSLVQKPLKVLRSNSEHKSQTDDSQSVFPPIGLKDQRQNLHNAEKSGKKKEFKQIKARTAIEQPRFNISERSTPNILAGKESKMTIDQDLGTGLFDPIPEEAKECPSPATPIGNFKLLTISNLGQTAKFGKTEEKVSSTQMQPQQLKAHFEDSHSDEMSQILMKQDIEVRSEQQVSNSDSKDDPQVETPRQMQFNSPRLMRILEQRKQSTDLNNGRSRTNSTPLSQDARDRRHQDSPQSDDFEVIVMNELQRGGEILND